MDLKPSLERLHTDLQFKSLSPVWAKLEIVFGLLAAGCGIPLMTIRSDIATCCGGLVLFVLGGYLAMAGHRSHLYQSNNFYSSRVFGKRNSKASFPGISR